MRIVKKVPSKFDFFLSDEIKFSGGIKTKFSEIRITQRSKKVRADFNFFSNENVTEAERVTY